MNYVVKYSQRDLRNLLRGSLYQGDFRLANVYCRITDSSYFLCSCKTPDLITLCLCVVKKNET